MVWIMVFLAGAILGWVLCDDRNNGRHDDLEDSDFCAKGGS
jgi:hypothetical protein